MNAYADKLVSTNHADATAQPEEIDFDDLFTEVEMKKTELFGTDDLRLHSYKEKAKEVQSLDSTFRKGGSRR